jgi:hypothetical protein
MAIDFVGGKTPAEYCYDLSFRLYADQAVAFHNYLTDLAKRLGGSKSKALQFIGYSNYAGAGADVHLFAPFRSFAELDGREDILSLLGPDAVQGINKGVKHVQRTILVYLPDCSNPGPSRNQPAPYLYHSRIRMKPTDALQLHDALGDVAIAQREDSDGSKYVAYSPYAGVVDCVNLYIPFAKFSELDKWKEFREILEEKHGKELTRAKYLQPLNEKIESYETSILIHTADLSV